MKRYSVKNSDKYSPENIALAKWWDDFIAEQEAIMEANKKKEAEELAEAAKQAKERELEFHAKDWEIIEDEDENSVEYHLREYRRTGDRNHVWKVWWYFRMLVRVYAKLYIATLPMKARQLYFGEANSEDYSEHLTEKMWDAIEAYNPDLVIEGRGKARFKTYFRKVVFNHRGNIINKMKGQYYINNDFISIDTMEGEKMMNTAYKQD